MTTRFFCRDVPASGNPTLSAATVYGALRGLETFSQVCAKPVPLVQCVAGRAAFMDAFLTTLMLVIVRGDPVLFLRCARSGRLLLTYAF